MTLQNILAESFIQAIELEQKHDLLASAHYLLSFTPKRLAAFGLAILNLSMVSFNSALGGKTSIELSLDPAYCQPGDEIPAGSLKVGDIVKLDRMSVSSGENNTSLEGVVTRLNGKSVFISIKENSFDESLLNLYNNTANDNNRMYVVKLTNSVTYKRMLQAMMKLNSLRDNDKSEVMKILLGESRFYPKLNNYKKLEYWNDNLNQSQKDAIEFSIFKSPITIIHGPPGTGKTYTLIELIKQLKFTCGEKILVCGASNISVDNILERLSPSFTPASDMPGVKKNRKRHQKKSQALPEKLIRIGHPARLLSSNLKHSLDVLSKSTSSVDGGDNQLVLKGIHEDIKNALTSIKKCKRFSERKVLWGEVRQLRRELREREKKITQDLLVNADVVLSTLHGAGSNELYNIYKTLEFSVENPLFDTIIIDEVSQSLEPQCWIPLVNHLGCRRLVIAGDNQQLPPSVDSAKEVQSPRKMGKQIADLEKTLFDRLIANHDGDEYRKMLNVQYRMNHNIMEFPSKTLYDGHLKAGESVETILLSDLSGVKATDETSVPCIWYDTQGGDFPEQIDEDSSSNMNVSNGSKFNDMEILVVTDHIQKLISAGLKQDQIGVISPYSAQVSSIKRLLSKLYPDSIEVSTIDGFQGREKEAIIVSLVRSNDQREVGFLNDFRRLNVAMTRPKRQLCVIGDMELLQQSGVQFLEEWAKYVDDNFEVRYPNIMDY